MNLPVGLLSRPAQLPGGHATAPAGAFSAIASAGRGSPVGVAPAGDASMCRNPRRLAGAPIQGDAI